MGGHYHLNSDLNITKYYDYISNAISDFCEKSTSSINLLIKKFTIDNIYTLVEAYNSEIVDSKVDDLILFIKNNLKLYQDTKKKKPLEYIIFRSSEKSFVIASHVEKFFNIDDIYSYIYRLIRNFHCIVNLSEKSNKDSFLFVMYSGCSILNDVKKISQSVNESDIALAFAKRNSTQYYQKYDDLKSKVESRRIQRNIAVNLLKLHQESNLDIAFQPIVDVNENIYYYECLVRLNNGNEKIHRSSSYIEAAQQMNCIDIIDISILERAVKILQQDSKIHLGVNVSRKSVGSAKWQNRAKSLLKDRPIASRLIIEIIETDIDLDIDIVLLFIKEIQSYGCRVAIDDFGSGYTALNHLKLLNVDLVKIDGDFVKSIMSNDDNMILIRSLISFAKNIRIKTVAEHIENKEIADHMKKIGADYMQGHYFGKEKRDVV